MVVRTGSERTEDPVGVVFGVVTTHEFRVLVSPAMASRVGRDDYLRVNTADGPVLGKISELERSGVLGREAALLPPIGDPLWTTSKEEDKIVAKVSVVGRRDEHGRLMIPRSPPSPGSPVLFAGEAFVSETLGLCRDPARGLYIGRLKDAHVPVFLDPNELIQKHCAVVARTGSGKSYTVGVILEECMERRVPAVVVDPHGEYAGLLMPNMEADEIARMGAFGISPKGYGGRVTVWRVGRWCQKGPRLVLGLEGLAARELAWVAGLRDRGAGSAMLYRATGRFGPVATPRGLILSLERQPGPQKWPLIAALEALDATELFGADGPTPLSGLVRPGEVHVIDLSGVPVEVQQQAVAVLALQLFRWRREGRIPPFLFAVEEAHTFCPQSGWVPSSSALMTLAAEGRKFGMGLLVVTQRPARVDKNVLSQCGTQVVMKVTNPHDLKAVVQSVEGLTRDAAEAIQRMPVSIACVMGGGIAYPVMVEVRPRRTRHGGRAVDLLPPEEDGEPEDGATVPIEGLWDAGGDGNDGPDK